jgi:hypothetical protein
MMTTLIRADDGSLIDALAGILARLRDCPSDDLRGSSREALLGAADHFVEMIASHFQRAEKILFQILREAAPGFAHDLERFEKDHRLFRAYVCDLAAQLKAGKDGEAYAVGRSFLAELLGKANHERQEVKRLWSSLEAREAALVPEFLSGGLRDPQFWGTDREEDPRRH